MGETRPPYQTKKKTCTTMNKEKDGAIYQTDEGNHPKPAPGQTSMYVCMSMYDHVCMSVVRFKLTSHRLEGRRMGDIFIQEWPRDAPTKCQNTSNFAFGLAFGTSQREWLHPGECKENSPIQEWLFAVLRTPIQVHGVDSCWSRFDGAVRTG